MPRVERTAGLLALVLVLACSPAGHDALPGTAPDPLPSWNEGESRQRILDFVARVTDPDSPAFVPEPERIAVFDNDGTLWSEKPLYFQLYFEFHIKLKFLDFN